MNETAYLGDTHHELMWESSLTGAQYRWTDIHGWEKKTALRGSEWSEYKPGQYTSTVYAYPNEKFTALPI